MKNFYQVVLYLHCLSVIYIKASPLQGTSVVPANENEFPFIASLADAPANEAKHHYCGATLISNRHILTAKHCLVNVRNDKPLKNIADIRVTIGSIDMTKGRKYNIKSWITYEDWAMDNNIITENIYHDMAIATLSEDINNVKLPIISKLKHKHIYGLNAVTAGWGITNDGIEPKLLQKASLHVISRKKCRINYINNDAPPYMLLNHLCTIHRPPVVFGCGDSGGPLLINGDELIGVNESVCANDIQHPNEQNTHQSIEYYREFIEAFAKQNIISQN